MKLFNIEISKKLTTVVLLLAVLELDQWFALGLSGEVRESMTSLVQTYLLVQGGADVVDVGFRARTDQLIALATTNTAKVVVPAAEPDDDPVIS